LRLHKKKKHILEEIKNGELPADANLSEMFPDRAWTIISHVDWMPNEAASRAEDPDFAVHRLTFDDLTDGNTIDISLVDFRDLL